MDRAEEDQPEIAPKVDVGRVDARPATFGALGEEYRARTKEH